MKRFVKIFITSAKESIRSLLKIDYPQIDSISLCLQINSTSIHCLSVDEKLLADKFSITPNAIDDDQLLNNGDPSSSQTNRKTHFYYRPRNTILFIIIIIALIAVVSRKTNCLKLISECFSSFFKLDMGYC